MDRVTSTLIDLAEAAYDLDAPDSQWLQSIIHAGLPLFDLGLGVAGGVYARRACGADPTLHQLHVAGGQRRLLTGIARVAAHVSPDRADSGLCNTLRRALVEAGVPIESTPSPDEHDAGHTIGLWVFDGSGMGVFVVSPFETRVTLSETVRRRWRGIGSHLSAAFHLRRGIASEVAHSPRASQRLRGVRGARRALREFAVRVDRSHECLRDRDRTAAVRMWRDVVEGRCTVVDRFEHGPRQFVLATCNPQEARDPHRLTKRESQVARLAVMGESGKHIGWELGLSPSRVSGILHDVMRKLRVHTQPELIERMRAVGVLQERPTRAAEDLGLSS